MKDFFSRNCRLVYIAPKIYQNKSLMPVCATAEALCVGWAKRARGSGSMFSALNVFFGCFLMGQVTVRYTGRRTRSSVFPGQDQLIHSTMCFPKFFWERCFYYHGIFWFFNSQIWLSGFHSLSLSFSLSLSLFIFLCLFLKASI